MELHVLCIGKDNQHLRRITHRYDLFLDYQIPFWVTQDLVQVLRFLCVNMLINKA